MTLTLITMRMMMMMMTTLITISFITLFYGVCTRRAGLVFFIFFLWLKVASDDEDCVCAKVECHTTSCCYDDDDDDGHVYEPLELIKCHLNVGKAYKI